MALSSTSEATTTTGTPRVVLMPWLRSLRRPGRASSWTLRGMSLGYLGVMVALPMIVLVIQSFRPGLGAFVDAVRDPFAWHALILTLQTAAIMVLVNAVTGTALAWVLAREEFPGKRFVNALIDLPFAVPTVVTGLMLVALYGPQSVLGSILGQSVIYHQPGIILALTFVCFPFVVRAVQPVLQELDPAEEEAAATLGAGPWLTFRRVILPALWPAIATGSAQAFSRALGEFGSVVLVAGNRPLETRNGPMYVFGEIESGHLSNAMVVSLVLLACAVGVLALLNLALRWGGVNHGR